MSTRSTISFVGPLHIYEEVLDGEVCVEFQTCLADGSGRKLNHQYKSPVLTREELIELRDDLIKYLKDNP